MRRSAWWRSLAAFAQPVADHLKCFKVKESQENVQITGGFDCQFANFGVGMFIDTLRSTFADSLGQLTGVCRVCGSNQVARCLP